MIRSNTYILILSLLSSWSLLSQNNGNVGINDSNLNPDPSAMLDVQSTSKGMLVPRMNTGQRTGISNAAVGLLVFDTDSESFWYNTSSGWVNLSSDVTVDNTLTGNGTAGSPLGLAQNGALDGQVLSWNGTSSSWKPTPGLWLPNGNNIAYANRNVGIGLNNPQRELQVKGDIVAEEDNSSAKGGLLMTDSMGVPRVHLNHIYSPNETQLRFEILVPNTSGIARVEFFRNTQALSKKVEFYRGGNFGTARSAVIGVDGENSFFQIHGGNLGIGTDVPTEKLHVVGNLLVDGNITATGSISPIAPDIAIFEEQFPSGSDFDGSSPYTKRQLNTEVLSSPSVKLTVNNEIQFNQPGVYIITASAYAYQKRQHKLVLRAVGTQAILLEGTSEFNNDVNNLSQATNRSFIMGKVTVPSSNYLCILDHYSSSPTQGNFGNGINATGTAHETYAQIMIQKIQ